MWEEEGSRCAEGAPAPWLCLPQLSFACQLLARPRPRLCGFEARDPQVSRSSFICLFWICVTLSPVAYFGYVFHGFWKYLSANDKSPKLNSWNLLVISPNSEFGVHLSRFYLKVGG